MAGKVQRSNDVSKIVIAMVSRRVRDIELWIFQKRCDIIRGWIVAIVVESNV
jgi:hypothetical protein